MMKKLFPLGITLLYMSSCISPYHQTVGDVIAFNADGSILNSWNSVILEEYSMDAMGRKSATKNIYRTYGLNFIDPQTGKGIILGNAVPYIIEYQTENHVSDNSTPVMSNKENILGQIKILEDLYNANLKIIKDKKSTEEDIKNAHQENLRLNNTISNLKNKLN